MLPVTLPVMASIRRKENSKYWFACFTLPSGRRTQRSTKTTDRKLAQKLADEFESATQIRLTERQARKVINDIHRTIGGQSMSYETLRDWLSQWIKTKKGTVSSTTFRVYRSVTDEFCEFLADRANEEMIYVTSANIASWRDANASKQSSSTANKKLKILRVAFRQAWRDGVIDDDPAAKVPTLKIKPSSIVRRSFTISELRSVLKIADDEWKGMILFGLYTGQRLGDLARLDWKHIDLETKIISFSTEKTGRRQILPLVASVQNWLETQYPMEDMRIGPLFPESHLTITRTEQVGTLSNRFYELLAEANLAPKRTHQKKKNGKGRSRTRQASELTFHSLRHTATSLMKNAGVSPAIVQEFIGHDSKAISDHYTHIETPALREAAEKLPSL